MTSYYNKSLPFKKLSPADPSGMYQIAELCLSGEMHAGKVRGIATASGEPFRVGKEMLGYHQAGRPPLIKRHLQADDKSSSFSHSVSFHEVGTGGQLWRLSHSYRGKIIFRGRWRAVSGSRFPCRNDLWARHSTPFAHTKTDCMAHSWIQIPV